MIIKIELQLITTTNYFHSH